VNFSIEALLLLEMADPLGSGKIFGWANTTFYTISFDYTIARRRNVLVADVLANNPLNIEFRRILSNDKWDMWIPFCEASYGYKSE
jgi:hypothetical protein